jgi:hypothetical protein
MGCSYDKRPSLQINDTILYKREKNYEIIEQNIQKIKGN